jgi:CHAD domain-containing protein
MLMDIIDELAESVREPEITISRRLFDSFDWRLFTAGVDLEWVFGEVMPSPHPGLGPLRGGAADRRVLCWRDRQKPDIAPVLQALETEPGLLVEMPAGPVRERLAGLLEMRRLLPMVDIVSQRTPLRVVNEDEKTTARLMIERNRFRAPDSGRNGTLACRLRLQPIRGYPEAFEQVRSLLVERLGLCAPQQSLADEAMRAAGHQPGAYSTKLDQQLDPDQRADLATKQILRDLLETLEANIDGARRNLDSEFLHDLRVATRRTRSALSQIKRVFPEGPVADFKQRFAWLQQVTGPVRDLDVYLLDFPEMQMRLPPDLRDDLGPLHEQLLRLHVEAQRELARALGSSQFNKLLRDWRDFLDAPVPGQKGSVSRTDAEPGPAADRYAGGDQIDGGRISASDQGTRSLLPKRAALPIERVADQRIRTMLKRVRAEGRAITEASPPEDLHELRKSCKKLRYLMEFFQSLYPKDRIREQIKQTKLLLDNLGRFQDAAVQAEHLREHAESSAADSVLPTRTLLAMGALIGQLLTDQARARSAFGKVFADFDSADNAERFASLLASGADKRPKARGDVVNEPGVRPSAEASDVPGQGGSIGTDGRLNGKLESGSGPGSAAGPESSTTVVPGERR